MHNPLLALSRLGLRIVLWTAIGLLATGTGVSLKAAQLLQDCELDLAAPHRVSGPSSRLDLTLLCPPKVFAELQPEPPRKPNPKLRALIREAIRKSLPPGSEMGRLEVRAAAAQIAEETSVTDIASILRDDLAATALTPGLILAEGSAQYRVVKVEDHPVDIAIRCHCEAVQL